MRDVMIKNRVSIGDIAVMVPSSVKFSRAEFAGMTGIAYPSTSGRLSALVDAGHAKKSGTGAATRRIIHEYAKDRMILEGETNKRKAGRKAFNARG